MSRISEALPDRDVHLSLNNWPEGERPREKLLALGPAGLSESELLAIILRSGSRRITALDLARVLLKQAGGLLELADLDYRQLYEVDGIGPVKAVTLAAAFELGRRLAALPATLRLKVSDPEVIFRRYEPMLGHLDHEVFRIVVLNSANQIIREVQISEGILNASLVHAREVFKEAILAGAASIILVHNHPSGEVDPSPQDRQVTDRLVEAGQLLEIPVLDHIIIARRQYLSFREAGYL